jgi:hypothetical protein
MTLAPSFHQNFDLALLWQGEKLGFPSALPVAVL